MGQPETYDFWMVCPITDRNQKLNDCFQSVSDGKALLASAITDKGTIIQADATFADMANAIRTFKSIAEDSRSGVNVFSMGGNSCSGVATVTFNFPTEILSITITSCSIDSMSTIGCSNLGCSVQSIAGNTARLQFNWHSGSYNKYPKCTLRWSCTAKGY